MMKSISKASARSDNQSSELTNGDNIFTKKDSPKKQLAIVI